MNLLICSVHFGAGHTAHLQAYQKISEECGYETAIYLHKDYMKLFSDIQGRIFFTEDEVRAFKPDVVWIYNTGTEDIKLIKLAKELHSRIVYVLHEPYMGFRELMKDGGYWYKELAASLLNTWICNRSDVVVLSSRCAANNCKKYMPGAYKKKRLFPLIFPDNYLDAEKKYFSLIGGYADSHASDEFLNFVKESADRNGIKFQIATRSEIREKLNDPVVKKMMDCGRLIVQQGRPLTESEMNSAYRTSIATWNAYKRSTQSGVLAHAFMQGSPVIASHVGSFDEYVVDGKTGAFIKNYSYQEIFNAYKRIEGDIANISSNCRKAFLHRFYYKNQEEQFKKIIESLES